MREGKGSEQQKLPGSAAAASAAELPLSLWIIAPLLRPL